jgi:UDP-N-acetylmuramoylalanine--D-glutamate ligase
MLLGVQNGMYYVDDSIATIPEATIAAMRTFSGKPITVLVGGFDRGLDQRRFAEALLDQTPYALITLPDTGKVLFAELQCLCSASAGKNKTVLRNAEDLDHAVLLAGQITPRGGLVLLSPGAASYNSHKDFAARGASFAKAAGFVPR